VIRHFGKDKAIVVGHDWGGAVAWSLATNARQFVERLIILNLPHLRGLNRELARNPEQKNSQYAQLSEGRVGEEPDSGRLGRLGQGRRGEAEVYRGVQEIELRFDDGILPAQLSASTRSIIIAHPSRPIRWP
jgi:pimeloyl-ACP methyl ester carboxylesterase